MRKPKIILLLLSSILAGLSAQAQVQMEKLTRGVVAMHKSDGNYITWRLLGTDPTGVTFDLTRDGNTIASNLNVTGYTDVGAGESCSYRVVTKDSAGNITDISATAHTWETACKLMKTGTFRYCRKSRTDRKTGTLKLRSESLTGTKRTVLNFMKDKQ